MIFFKFLMLCIKMGVEIYACFILCELLWVGVCV